MKNQLRTELEKQNYLIDNIDFMLRFLSLDDLLKTWEWLSTEFFEGFRGESIQGRRAISRRIPE
jgi:hypothetical protein